MLGFMEGKEIDEHVPYRGDGKPLFMNTDTDGGYDLKLVPIRGVEAIRIGSLLLIGYSSSSWLVRFSFNSVWKG